MQNEDRSEKVALLFEECIEISDPVKRSAFLDAACAGRADVRSEVEALLQAHEASGCFLGGGTPPSAANSDSPTSPGVADLGPGGCVGPYHLIGLIGEGGTSTVFLAEQEEPVRRWVALKIVKPGMDTRKVLLRFSLERQALALMDHPGIAKLLDAGATSGGRPFFVMELVSGVGITAYCDEHRLTIRQRLDLFIQVCDAVLHAHQRGIIHRDLKPDNILVCNCDGRAAIKIIDFGIAKALHTAGLDNATRTAGMPFLGTPAYMSPEQVQLTSPELDTRTDIYSLGALLYELLTGHPPFDHADLMGAGIEGMCRIIRTSEPLAPPQRVTHLPADEQTAVAAARGTSPSELRRMLAGDLDWITLKALEKSRDRRYATAAGFAEDIHRHFEHLPVSAAGHSRRYRLVKLLRRNRKLVVGASLVASLLLVSAVAIIYMAIDARMSANEARTFEKAATLAERQSHRAMVAMHVSSGMSSADDRYYDKAVLWFANAARVAGQDDYQSEVNARRALCWMSRVSIPIGAFKLPATFLHLEFSQDSRYLLAIGRDHSWHLWDSLTQAAVAWSLEVKAVRTAAWSPEGSRLALVIPDGQVRVHEVSDGTLHHALHVSPSPETVGFTSDSRRLVLGGSTVHVFDLEGNLPARAIPQHTRAVVGLAFSPRSTEVAAVGNDDRAWVLETLDESGGEAVAPRVFPHRHVIRTDSCTSKSNYREDFLEAARLSLPALAADGTRLITRTGSYDVTIWDVLSGDSILRVDDVCCSCRFITSPETGLLACGLQGGKVGLWDIVSARPRQLLPSQGACILDIAFGMEGKGLITAEADGMARLWSVDEGRELQSPLHHCTDVDKVAFASNGRMAATGQSDGLVRVWTVFDPEPDEHSEGRDDLPTVARMDGAGRNFVLAREPGWDACIGQVTVYSASSAGPIGSTMLFDSCVDATALSPNSDMLAIGIAPLQDGASGRLDFRDPSGRRQLGRSIVLPSGPASVAWHPTDPDVAVICRSGELLIARPGRGTAEQWRGADASQRPRINPMARFSHDGRTLVSLGPDGNIEVREFPGGRLRYPRLESGPDGFWSFVLCRDSRHLATGTVNGEVTIWNLNDGAAVGGILRHPSWVYRCRFSPDEQILVTASHDGKARLWDWHTGRLLAEPLVHPGEVYDAVFTPDNRWLLTACRDGNVRIWEPHSGQIVAPPIKIGQQAFNIEITRDGNHAVIGSLGRDVVILSLDVLNEDLPYDAEELCLLGEVVSGSVVVEGAIRDLTTSEWLERYERIRRLHPAVFQSGQSYGLEKLAVEKAAVFEGVRISPEYLTSTAGQAAEVAFWTVAHADDVCATCPSFGETCDKREANE